MNSLPNSSSSSRPPTTQTATDARQTTSKARADFLYCARIPFILTRVVVLAENRREQRTVAGAKQLEHEGGPGRRVQHADLHRRQPHAGEQDVEMPLRHFQCTDREQGRNGG